MKYIKRDLKWVKSAMVIKYFSCAIILLFGFSLA